MTTVFILFLFILVSVLFFLRRRKASRRVFLIALVCFLSVGCGVVPFLLVKNLEIYPELTQPQWGKKNAIVVLGAGAVKLPLSKLVIPTTMAYPRIHQATRLYHECKNSGNECIIITSGDDALAAGAPEGAVYRKELLALGIASTDVIAESHSMNTYQNAKFTSAIIKAGNFDAVFLVTSGVHLKRALLYFAEFGIEPVPAPADYLRPQFSLFPRGYNFAVSDAAAHEYVGIAKLYVYNFMKWNR